MICQHKEHEIEQAMQDVCPVCLVSLNWKLLEACKFAKSQIKKRAPKKALPVLRNAIAAAEGGKG